jgi:hypothetical protein
MWQEDHELHAEDMDYETHNTTRLHCKYLNLWSIEKTLWRKHHKELKTMRAIGHLYYQGLLDMEDLKHPQCPWKTQYQGTPYRSEEGRKQVVERDPFVIEKEALMGAAEDKVSYLEDVLAMIHNRGFQIKDIMIHRKHIFAE